MQQEQRVLEQAEEIYPFQEAVDRDLFNKILHELRCSICQNQSLADSRTSLALDLKREIYQKVLAHQSKKDILTFVAGRYGTVILYDPPVTQGTLLLWGGPALMLGLGVILLRKYIRWTS